MDRKIPKEIIKKEKRKKWIVGASVTTLAFASIAFFISYLEVSVKESDIIIGQAEKGTIESSVSASGKVVPLYEVSIVSPVATRILEVYCEEGDSVSSGESLLKLDLQTAETELRRLSDEVTMKHIETEQVALNNETYITDLEMKIKTKEMALEHLKAEVANEKRLDSIGSGTGERIREAELAYNTSLLELEQMKIQLKNEKKAHDASLRNKKIEESITGRNRMEMERTLEDARIKTPKDGTVTFLNKNLGTSVSAGERLAVISDLKHFKIFGEIPEGNAGKLSVGSLVKIRINRETLTGHISNIAPQSKSGMVEFNVLLDKDDSKALRSGLRAEMNVIYDIIDDVVRIPNGQYFQGAGPYRMFVKTASDRLERRDVTLGDSNFDYVEVKSGLNPGEEVVLTEMNNYENRKSIKLKTK